MPTFLWHDYETFGANPRADRPSQFAAIRTDAELNEVGTPCMWYCQPAPDYLPDAQACLITGITPQQCLREGLPEYRFAHNIERELAQPETIGAGYNSMHFDDEVTRFMLWRNLADPYAREWQNGCGRWDLLNLVRAAWALRPEGLRWPVNENGRTSFRLEHLATANDLLHEKAHDALSDVRATIALARRLRDAQPRLFEFSLTLRDKRRVLEQIRPDAPQPFLHVSGMIPVERGCLMLAWPLAQHPFNKNEIIVWDLAHDPEELFSLDADSVRQRLFSKNDDLPENVTRLPVKTIHINRAPIVVSQLKTLSPMQAERWGMNIEQQLHHARKLQQAPSLDALWRKVYAATPAAATDVDTDLYNGFVGNDDRRTLERLRELDGEALAQARPTLQDTRLEELLFRYRARNFPHTLNEEENARWHRHCTARLLHGEQGARSLQQLSTQIDALAESADERGEEILGDLYDYAETLMEHI